MELLSYISSTKNRRRELFSQTAVIWH